MPQLVYFVAPVTVYVDMTLVCGCQENADIGGVLAALRGTWHFTRFCPITSNKISLKFKQNRYSILFLNFGIKLFENFEGWDFYALSVFDNQMHAENVKEINNRINRLGIIID